MTSRKTHFSLFKFFAFMKKVFQFGVLLTCFIIHNASAQVAVEEVVIHGTPWGGTSGGGGSTSSGVGGNGLEPTDKDLERFEPRPKLLRSYTKLSASGRRFLVTEFDDNGEWLIKARETFQEGKPYSSMEIFKNFESWEAFAEKANSITWCKEWIESEEKSHGLSGTLNGEIGTPLVKGGVEGTVSGTKTNSKQYKNTQCATIEQ